MSSEKTDFFSRKKKKKGNLMSLETESIVKYLFWDSYILAQSSPADSQFLQVIQIDGDAPPDRPAAFLKISKHFFFSFFFFCHTDQFLLDHGSNVLGEKCSTRKKKQRFCWTQFGEENMELWTYLSNGTNQKLRSPPHPSLFVPSGFWTI